MADLAGVTEVDCLMAALNGWWDFYAGLSKRFVVRYLKWWEWRWEWIVDLVRVGDCCTPGILPDKMTSA